MTHTVEDLVSKAEQDLAISKGKIEENMKELDGILDTVDRQHRANLTSSETEASNDLIAQGKRLRAAHTKLETRLENARKAQREEDAAIRAAGDTHTVSHSANALMGANRNGDSSQEWRYSNSGRVAGLTPDQRYADHELVREEMNRHNERDLRITESFGDFGQYLRATTTSSASAVVPTTWSASVIDKARNAAVCMQAGATTVPMDAKIVQIGRLTADPTAAYKAEGNAVTASDPGVDYVQLNARSLGALVVVSMEFLMDAVDSDTILQNSIAQAMALELDKAILYGQMTTGNEGFSLANPYPVGLLRNLLDNASGQVLGGATNGTTQVSTAPYAELLNLYYAVKKNNETPNALISNDAMVQHYDMLTDTLNRPMSVPDRIAKLPWLTTNMIPTFTSGTMTSTASDVFAGDFSQVLVGQRLNLEVRLLTERYAENGQVGILAYSRNDVAVARPKALACYRYLNTA